MSPNISGSCSKLLVSYGNFLFVPSKNKKNDFRHTRPSVYAEDKKKIFKENKINRGLVPLSPPKSQAHKKISEAVFSKIFQNLDPKNGSIEIREHLLLFHHGHRAREGYIYIQNADDGIKFINWLLSLNSEYHIIANITGASLSDIPLEDQIQYWKKGLSKYTARAEVRLVKEGRIKRHRYGTASIKIRASSLSIVQKNSSAANNSWAVRYALLMACIIKNSIGSHRPPVSAT